jgi:hypothetical protein
MEIKIHFTELNNIGYYLHSNIYWIREVILPDDANIYVEKFILKEKIEINKLLEWTNLDFCKLSIQQNSYALKFMKYDL